MAAHDPHEDLDEQRRLVRRSTVLSHGAYRLWDELLDNTKDGRCLLGQDGLASRLNWSTRTVRRNMNELTKVGLVKLRKFHRQNVYVLTFKAPKKAIQTLLPSPPDDLEELIEETEEDAEEALKARMEQEKMKRPRRRGRGKNKVDPALGGNTGQMTDKPVPPGVVAAKPLPRAKPMDLLDLLIDEIELKYGVRAVATVGRTIKAQESKRLRTEVIENFDDSKIVIAMIRVLVWDWEVARQACWPKSTANYPSISHLLAYSDTLASATTTGLKRTGDLRGARNTYASRYLRAEDDDPDALFGGRRGMSV